MIKEKPLKVFIRENYMSQQRCCDYFGCAKSSIDRMIKDGFVVYEHLDENGNVIKHRMSSVKYTNEIKN